MCNYRCPFADRRACAGFLLCKDLYKDGVDYNNRTNAMTVICAFQKQCMVTGRMENTDSAKECYKNRWEARNTVSTEEADIIKPKKAKTQNTD